MGGRGLTAVGAGLVGLVTALLFWPAVGYDWLRFWDDGAHLIWNEAYKGLSPTHLSWMIWPFLGQWMPLTWLSWAIDFTLWGLDPAAFHRTNVLLHALNAGLLFLVARRLLHSTTGAALAALLWAVHPMRVESVAWINERRDVLSGLFYLLTILTYLKAVERPTPHRRWLAVSVGCFALAILSKALVVSLPVVLLLLDYYPLGRRRFYLEKVPYVVLSAIGVVMAFVALAKMEVISPLAWISLEDRALIAAYSLWFYLTTSVWPTGLSPLYELTFHPVFLSVKYLIPVLGVAVGSWVAWRARRTWPAWTVVWVAYVVTVLPVSGIVQNGYQLVALRYSYLATLPVFVLAGGLLAAWVVRAPAPWRVAVVGMGGGGVVVLTLLTSAFLPVFHDGLTFWTRTVRMDPACVVCSDSLLHQEQMAPAWRELTRLVTAHPTLQEQRWHLAILAFIRAHGDEGEAHLREYLRQVDASDPGYIRRIEVGRQNHALYARRLLSGQQMKELETFTGSMVGLEKPLR